MPLKKKEEVCGKPNQYNLKTLEYDWKELPDTHIQVPPQQPRIRNYPVASAPAAAGGAASPPPKLNPITHQPVFPPGAGLKYTPLPSPSKPVQEEARRNTPHGRYSNNNRKDDVAELFDGGGGAFPAVNVPARASPPQPVEPPQQPPVPLPVYPYDASVPELDRPLSRSPPLPPPISRPAYGYEEAAPAMHRNDGHAVVPWSHDDIRRVVTSNALEAQRSYLR